MMYKASLGKTIAAKKLEKLFVPAKNSFPLHLHCTLLRLLRDRSHLRMRHKNVRVNPAKIYHPGAYFFYAFYILLQS